MLCPVFNVQLFPHLSTTQDEQRWLDLGVGLREQSISEECVLILRKKYFYSDQVCDRAFKDSFIWCISFSISDASSV